MKLHSLRCGICSQWHLAVVTCPYCGALRIVHHGKVRYFNRTTLVEMVRAIPLPANETVMDRVIKRAVIEHNKTAKKHEPKVNARFMRLLITNGMNEHQARELASKGN